MSIENHPNFHAVKFTTEIMKAFQECLRGSAVGMQIDDIMQIAIIEFINEIEDHVDREAGE